MREYNNFDKKRILIWGFGAEGKSTKQFIEKHCNTEKLDVYSGGAEDINFDEYDYVIKSPGIPYLEENPKVISQTDIFLNTYGKNIIGITGTKGKSTTAAMLNKVLGDCSGRKVFFVGNIGVPCLDLYDDIGEEDIVVFEMSCHQLLHAKESPHVAIITNLYEDHLDYYKTVEKYQGAKLNITKYQGENDFLYIGEDCGQLTTNAKKEIIYNDQISDIELINKSASNLIDANIVFRVATEIFDCDGDNVLKSLGEYTGLPHRMEFICEKDNIRFYDDAISTIPKATINAARSLEGKKIILIGGLDRGIDYTELIDEIRTNSDAIFVCMYETGRKIYAMANASNVILVDDLYQAVEKVFEIADGECSCVLSPAAPSYDSFKNFEEKGQKFKEYINAH